MGKLSNDERIEKVKSLLKALANYHHDFTDIAPFVKQKIGDSPDPYGNVWNKDVKVFDRKANNFGHGPKNQTTPKGTNSYLGEAFSRKHFVEVCLQNRLDIEQRGVSRTRQLVFEPNIHTAFETFIGVFVSELWVNAIVVNFMFSVD
jgi:hypothetical protein